VWAEVRTLRRGRRYHPVVPSRYELTPHAFVAGGWEPVVGAVPDAVDGLRVLTWNVWFGGHMFDERADALLAELERRRPDVIALQEVTPALLALIARAPWVRAGYQLSDEEGWSLRRYGVLLLSRRPLCHLSLRDLPSRMDRALLVAELACGLTVATVHLESTAGCAAERAIQLGIIQPVLAGHGDVVLVGDMNFAPGAPRETAVLDPALVDVWPALHGAAPGFTVDTDVNTMRFQAKSVHDQKRIDRVFLRGQRWRASSIELVGTAPFDDAGTFPSDHFGLEVALVRQP
jgi:endonuclease/exonuclease/phosphatase family metal-dependent hydrolase